MKTVTLADRERRRIARAMSSLEQMTGGSWRVRLAMWIFPSVVHQALLRALDRETGEALAAINGVTREALTAYHTEQLVIASGVSIKERSFMKIVQDTIAVKESESDEA